MTTTGQPAANDPGREVRIVLDGQAFELPADTNLVELRRRVAQAVFRCEVEQLHLADGRAMLVNWRAVRTILIELTDTASHRADRATRRSPDATTPARSGEPPCDPPARTAEPSDP